MVCCKEECMAWECRGDSNYFYAARREGGRVVKDYFGRGSAAVIAAELAWEAIRRRIDARGEVAAADARLKAARLAASDLAAVCRSWSDEALGVVGYHRPNRGPWRRRRGAGGPRRRGHESRIGLRHVRYVEPAEAREALAAWSLVYAAGEPALAEEVRLSAGSVREALVGPEDPPVLKLLAANAASTWLEARCVDAAEAEAREGVSLRRATAARASARAAKDRHTRPFRELGTARRLLGAHDHSPRLAGGTAARRPLPVIMGGHR
jgi:hypothetical protein